MSQPKAIREKYARLTLRVVNPHAKDCTPGPVGGRWKIDRDWGHQLIPAHPLSFWGDKRGDGWWWVVLVCNSTPGCTASALVRLEDIEFAAEQILN